MKILWTGTCPECDATHTMQCNDANDRYAHRFIAPCHNCGQAESNEPPEEWTVVMVAEVLN